MNKKVLFLHTNIHSGGSQVMFNLYTYLKPTLGAAIGICFIGKDDHWKSKLTGDRDAFFINTEFTSLRTFLALFRLVRSGRYDVMYSHGPATHFMCSFLNLMLRRKLLIHLHGNFSNDVKRAGGNNPLKKILRKILFKLSVTRYISISKLLKSEFMSEFGIPSDRIEVIHNGIIDLSKSPINKKFTAVFEKKYKLEGNFIILTVGRLVDVKNQIMLIHLANYLNINHAKLKFKIFIAGDGHLHSFLQDKINEFYLSKHVFLTGPVDNTDIPTLLSLADVFILPSLYEGISISALEALSMKTPVLLSKEGGNPEILDGHDEFLFSLGDVYDLGDKVLAVHKALKQKDFRKSFYRIYTEGFDMDVFAGKIRQVFDRL